MAENVLYYPYIKVPNSEWFTRVLLYWDSVGSIVPYEYIRKPARLGPYMHSLVREGLVKQIIPSSHIYKIPNFTDAFLEYAENYKRQPHPTRNALIGNYKPLRVHIEKLADIGSRLCKMQLAKEAGYPWYDIDYQLANRFMAYLAGVLGNLPEINSNPITDQQMRIRDYEASIRRTMVLDELLPAPIAGIPADQIVEFKLKNQKYLLKFRNEIESFILQVAPVPQQSLRTEMVNRFILSKKVDIAGIAEEMKAQGWGEISLGRFLSYAVAGTTLANAIRSGSLLATIAAAFGIAASGLATLKETKTSDLLKNSSCAYAVLFNKFSARNSRNSHT